jgi:hypothetical protein
MAVAIPPLSAKCSFTSILKTIPPQTNYNTETGIWNFSTYNPTWLCCIYTCLQETQLISSDFQYIDYRLRRFWEPCNNESHVTIGSYSLCSWCKSLLDMLPVHSTTGKTNHLYRFLSTETRHIKMKTHEITVRGTCFLTLAKMYNGKGIRILLTDAC